MKKFKEYFNDLDGYAEFSKIPQPQQNVLYYAYLNGEIKGKFKTLAEAQAVSKITERIVTNREEIDAYWAQDREYHTQALAQWHIDLRASFDVSDAIFQKCYERAYESHHSYGVDEVFFEIEDVVRFVKEVLAVANEE